jgi:hypothetical protein
MAIEIGAKITGIVQREVVYMEQGAPAGNPLTIPAPVTQTLYIRDVAFEIVGMPAAVQPVPRFVVAVTDATQWDTLQVGQTCTVVIHPPA